MKPVKVIAQQELKEELSLTVSLNDIKVGNSFTLQNPKEKRRYIVFPCLVVLTSRPKITLDREHTEYAWISREKLEAYHILDDLPYVIAKALDLR
jgi:8-oxo-dGTP pyrophosphatase MutT (NUDIX family)